MDAQTAMSRTLAEDLVRRHATGGRFKPVCWDDRPLAIDDAYAVQDAFVQLVPGFRRGAGYKIGLTSPAMQAMCGIDHPIYGELRADSIHPSSHRIELKRFAHLGLECEIAVRLGRDLASAREPTRQDVLECCDGVCAAFEMVDDANADYGALDAGSLVADNAWNAGVVLGPWVAAPADLADLRGTLSVDSKLIDSARVGDALSHPFDSVLWLAAALRRRGRTLAAGAIVMTGSIVKTRFPAPHQKWSYVVQGLGSVQVSTF